MLNIYPYKAWIILLTGLFLLFFISLIHAQQPYYPTIQATPDALTPGSSIEVPVQIPLKPWAEKIEQLTPLQAGHWHSWKKKHGVEAKYRAWRGPLVIQAEGDSILMQAHVRYWLKGRTRLPGPFEISASCGVKETPRQAIIGVRVKFDWNADWTLQPRVQILPTRFLDRCQITSLNIDVTPIIGQLFNRELKKSIHKSLGQLDDDLKKIRQQAARLWKQVNNPIGLANNSWLSLHPTDIAAAPFFGYQDQMLTYIKISLQPQLVHGVKPESDNRPLPPLESFFPGDNLLTFNFSMPLDYVQISQQLSQLLAVHQFSIQDNYFSITAVKLTAEDSLLTASLSLSGAAAGKATISGRLMATPPPDRLTLESLDYTFEPEDLHLKILANLFHDKIRQELEKAANTLIRQKTESFAVRLQNFFQSALSEQIKIQFDNMQLTATKINLHSSGLVLTGIINGKVRLDFIPGPDDI